MIGRNPNPTPEELLLQLRSFLSGSKRASDMKECIYNGLWLLRHLPVARDAVFDLISVIYMDFANKHLSKLEQVNIQNKEQFPFPVLPTYKFNLCRNGVTRSLGTQSWTKSWMQKETQQDTA
jgi:hypothetical protein